MGIECRVPSISPFSHVSILVEYHRLLQAFPQSHQRRRSAAARARQRFAGYFQIANMNKDVLFVRMHTQAAPTSLHSVQLG